MKNKDNSSELTDMVLNYIVDNNLESDLSKKIQYIDDVIYKYTKTYSYEDPDFLPSGTHPRPEIITKTDTIYRVIRTYKVDFENTSREFRISLGDVLDYPTNIAFFSPIDISSLKEGMLKNSDFFWIVCIICGIDIENLHDDLEMQNMEKEKLKLQQRLEFLNDRINFLDTEKSKIIETLEQINSKIESFSLKKSDNSSKKIYN